MKLILDTRKTIEENAAFYFEKAKKAKKKSEGLEKAILISKGNVEKNERREEKEQKVYQELPPKKWFMKFRWFYSSQDFLCIGGNDATSNEIIVKKHAEKGDLVFHTDLAGSPFFVIKASGKEIPQKTKEEAAQATLSFSRAWNQGLSTGEVYAITPEQVKKELGLPKGAFMIHGKREYFKPLVKLFIGVNKENYLECSPVEKEWELKQEGKKTDTAKYIHKLLKEKYNVNYPLDEIVRALPGECSLNKK